MRIGTRVGPFFASTSTAGCGSVLGTLFAVFLVIGVAITYPIVGIILGVLLLALIWWIGSAAMEGRRVRAAREAGGEHSMSAGECEYSEEQGVEALKILADLEELGASGDVAVDSERFQRMRAEAIAMIKGSPIADQVDL